MSHAEDSAWDLESSEFFDDADEGLVDDGCWSAGLSDDGVAFDHGLAFGSVFGVWDLLCLGVDRLDGFQDREVGMG